MSKSCISSLKLTGVFTKISLLVCVLIVLLSVFAVRTEASVVQELSVSDLLEADNVYCGKNSETGYAAIIFDQANLLSESEEVLLREYVENVTPFCTAIFVSSKTEHSDDSVSYARSLLEDMCDSIGLDAFNATIFLIDMDTRKLAIYSGETTYKVINTALADSITDNTYTYASRGDYFGCAREVFSQIYKVLDGQAIAQPMRYISAALLAIFVGLTIGFILVRSKTKRGKPSFSTIMEAVKVHDVYPNITAVKTSEKRVRHVEYSGGGGGFSGGGGGGGFSGGGGGGSSGGGGGGSHSF